MLSCKKLVAHSSDYIDGQLPLSQRLSLRLHLAMCVNCRRFIKQFRLADGAVRSLPRGQSNELDQLAAKLAELHRQQR
jgi:anti-sigma factor RsiW